MNNGVKIIVDRMRTNPEEFHAGVHSRWHVAISKWWDLLTPEEKSAYRDGMRGVMDTVFEQEVVKLLMRPEDKGFVGTERLRITSSGAALSFYTKDD